MKKNFLRMVCCCLGLLLFTSVSCATKSPEMEAQAYNTENEVLEAQAVEEATAEEPAVEYVEQEPALNGEDQALADEPKKEREQQVPNVSVNVLQVNRDEHSPVTNPAPAPMADNKLMKTTQEASPDTEAGEGMGTDITEPIEPPAEKGDDVRVAKMQRVPTKYNVYQYMPDASKSLGTETLLSEISKEISGKVFYELKEEGEKNFTAKVAVVNAVPLSDLKRETEFGRIMGEYLLTDLADRGLKVTELRMGREINILPQTGEFIMSRNIGELANNAPELDYVVITTFSNTRKTLIVQGRLVSLQDGLVKTSWRYGLPLNRELLGLFHTVEAPFKIAVKGIGR